MRRSCTNKSINQIWTFAVVVMFLFSNCHTIRHTLKEPLKEKGPEYLFENLKKNELVYHWFSAKFSADIVYNKKDNNINGIIRIKKDSLIWISLSPAFGIEIARLLINNDSIFVVNRFSKTYLKYSFDKFNSMFNTSFDFDMLQTLLTDNDFTYYDNDKFKARIENREYRLSTVNRQKIKRYVRKSNENLKILLQDLWLDPQTFKITQNNLNEIKDNRKLIIKYSDYITINNQLFPEKLQLDISDHNPISVLIKFSKINITEPLSFPFKIPSDYKNN